MKIGCCQLKFHLHGNHSLKGKRKVVSSMKDRVRSKFNVSIAEVGDNDIWQSIELGVAAVGPDPKYIDGLIKQVVDYLDNMQLAEMTDCKFELIHVGQEYQ